MENTTSTSARSASPAWKLALLLPLAPAITLQVLSHNRTDVHSKVTLSVVGNIFLVVSLIAQSLYLMRRSTRWGIALLIFSGVVLGFGLHALVRLL